jgi:thiol-disulfide isomerase/thioredoxin
MSSTLQTQDWKQKTRSSGVNAEPTHPDWSSPGQQLRGNNPPVAATTNQVLYFTGARCTTCKAMTPVVRAAADDYSSNVELVEIDVATNLGLARSHSVTSVPAFVSVHEGTVVGRAVGAQTRNGVSAVFAGAADGPTRSIPLSMGERLLRVGTAAAVAGVAYIAGQPLLLFAVAGFAALAFWDRMPFHQR